LHVASDRRTPTLVLRVVLPFAAGYFLSYLFRTVNAVVGPELAADPTIGRDGLGAGALGLLTSAYFLAFAVSQLPIGIMLDRYGSKRVVGTLLVLAAAGSVMFAFGDSVTELMIARALIGLGVAACMVGAFKAFRQWFDAARLPLLQGLVMASGGLGAMTATIPVEAALSVTDWRGVFLGLAAVSVLVFLGVALAVPGTVAQQQSETLGDQLRGLVSIFASRRFWSVAPASMVGQALYMSAQGLWAGPWMQDVAGLSKEGAADILFMMAVSMVCGHLLTGTLAERLGQRGISPIYQLAVGNVIYLGLITLVAAGVTAAPWLLWPAVALTGTSGILAYAITAQSFPPHMAGRVNTALNLMVFIGAFTIQWGIGGIIDLWAPAAAGGYPVAAYQVAFGSVTAVFAATVAWLLFNVWRTRAQHQ